MPGAPSSSSASAARYSVLRPPRPPPSPSTTRVSPPDRIAVRSPDLRSLLSRAARARGRALALRRRDRRRAARRDTLLARGSARPPRAPSPPSRSGARCRRANVGIAGLRRLPLRVAQDRCKLARAPDSDTSRGSRSASACVVGSGTVGPDAIAPTSSPGTSEITNVATGFGCATAASRPPFKRDRCLRTQLISRMSAPWRIKKFAAARFCSNVSDGQRLRRERRAAARDQAAQRLAGAQLRRELEQPRAGREARAVGRRMAGLDDLDTAALLARLRARGRSA